MVTVRKPNQNINTAVSQHKIDRWTYRNATVTFPRLKLVEAAQWRNVFTVWCGSSHRPQHNPTSQGWTGTAAHNDINNQQRWRYNDSSPHLHQNLNSCLFGPTWTVSSSTATLTSVTSLSTHTTQDETCHQNGFMQPPSSAIHQWNVWLSTYFWPWGECISRYWSAQTETVPSCWRLML